MKNNTNKDAYLKRLRDLADVNKTSIKESQNRTLGTLIDFVRAADGVAYGIVQENHNYFLKRGGTKENPNVSDFAYIGGLANITNYQYKSLGDADKNRNMILHTINEANTTKVNPNGSTKKILNEDRAGQAIDNAQNMLGDLDAASAANQGGGEGEAEMAAGLTAEPQGGENATPPAPEAAPTDAPAPDMGGGAPTDEPAPDMGGEPDLGGGEPDMGGEPDLADAGLDGDSTGDDAGMAGMAGDADALAVDEPLKELEKGIGKITNTIRKTDLEPEMSKSFLKSFIQAFRDKLPELEIEERKEIANMLLKIVPPEDVENLSDTMPPEETGDEGIKEEEGCSECGTFAQYAESMGYDTAESLMECGEEGVANLVSNYANHAADGQNDGDAESVALVIKVINPEMLNTLKNDYGHEDYANKLEPMVNSMSESTDEDNMTKLNELFGGLRGAMGSIGKGISGAAQGVGKAISGAATQAGQAIDKGVTNVKQGYHSGEVAGEVKKLEGLANNLGAQVAALNARLVKAGQAPVDANKIIAAISNQIRAGKGASLAGTTAGAGVGQRPVAEASASDPAYTETQPTMNEDNDELEGIEGLETGNDSGAEEMEAGIENEPETEEKPEEIKFAGAQSLGGGVMKPDGAPTTISVTSQNGTAVEVSLNEVMKKLKQVVAESKPSTELSKDNKSKTGGEITKKGNEDEIMTESEKKIRAYVRKRLEEQSGLRKPSLNEDKKSTTLKRLDEIIDKQFSNYKTVVNKKMK